VPRDIDLDEVFLHRLDRTIRKDGTVRWRGGLLEVRADLGEKRVELRFDPADETALPRVFVGGRFACDTVPLDRLKNMTRTRRRVTGEPAPFAEPSGLDPLALIEDEHYRRTRPAGAGPEDDDEEQ
jgi:putative transposase